MANPLVEAVTPATHTFANVGDFYDFEVRAIDPDVGPDGTVTHELLFHVEDQAGNRTPITLTVSYPVPGEPEGLTWLAPDAADIPAAFTAELLTANAGNPATATYRVTRTA